MDAFHRGGSAIHRNQQLGRHSFQATLDRIKRQTVPFLQTMGQMIIKGPAKLLANGEITSAVVVRGVKLSAGAKQKIEAAGGKVEA